LLRRNGALLTRSGQKERHGFACWRNSQPPVSIRATPQAKLSIVEALSF
jgi:hypothetical protein